MPRRTWMSASISLACLVAGCRGVNDRELLESKLRQQEDQLAQVTSRLEHAEAELIATQRAAATLQQQLTDRGQAVLVAEQAAVLHRATEVRVQPWLSGGVDRDGVPGDDALKVLVVPTDASGDTLKLPGSIDIDLFDHSRPAAEQSIAHRQIPPEQVASLWHRGLLGTGYLIEIPWDRTPTRTELTVHVKFAAPDGREFHTTQAVRVRPPGANAVNEDEQRTVRRPVRIELSPARPNPVAGPPIESDRSRQAIDDKNVLQTSDRFTEATIPRLR